MTPLPLRRPKSSACGLPSRSRCGRSTTLPPSLAALFQVVLDLVEAAHHAFLVDAGRTGHADAADDLVANFDRHAAWNGDHARQCHLLAHDRIAFVELLGV